MKKSIKLSPADRAAVQAIADQMMAMNNRNDVNANQSSTFGHLWSAIKALVLNQTGIDIGNADWNLGGTGGPDVGRTLRPNESPRRCRHRRPQAAR
jgi:hypothetical protein